VKSLGDGFMIAFSSATNAIHCAQDIRDRAAAGWHGHRINVRAGIHTGDAIRDLDDFFGHAVNVAARVAAIADGGEIVVTRVVRELVRGGPFTFDHLRSTPLKGIDDPVEIATVAPHLPADPRPDGPGARRRPRAPTDATPAIQLRQAPQ
jgi:class 3 adenylate cyclase